MSATLRLAIIGAGIAGCASAWWLTRRGKGNGQGIQIFDRGAPLELTTAASGENYRTWWPQPELSELIGRSLDIVEDIARDTGNQPHLTRLGYVYATRTADTGAFVAGQLAAYPHLRADIRVHDSARNSYVFDPELAWHDLPGGIDVVTDRGTIARHFPDWDEAVTGFVHVRRAGDLSAQQLGAYMLAQSRLAGVSVVRREVLGIEPVAGGLSLTFSDGSTVRAEQVLLAAGPFTRSLAQTAGVELPLECVYQQKIAFRDADAVIARHLPFTIDLDPQVLDWSAAERAELADSKEYRWLAQEMPGGVHRRPDGGPRGSWVKLGWAYATTPAEPVWQPEPDQLFKEVVLRGAARLHPALRRYYGRLPRAMTHYGGYYTRTIENLPLIGPTSLAGLYVLGGLSGYGTMAAAAGGELAAMWIRGEQVPAYGHALAPARYRDHALMQSLRARGTGEL